MKKLPDLDKDHPFYSDEADKEWRKRIKACEEEEKNMLLENRKRWKDRNKKSQEDLNDGTDQE